MSTGQSNGVIRELRKVRPDPSGRTDAELLADYLRRPDGEALAALIRRHGPLVWGVCRRVLGHHQDAEDAFQATFLVLVRRAGSIAATDLLANWLYGTAHLTARKARSRAAKRRERERQVPAMPEPISPDPYPLSGLEPVLDAELSRLPARYRAVIVLCDLEGHTRPEAARQLGCPEGTVASRLARARAMLASRLARRGIVLSGGAVAAVLTRNAASAYVPKAVMLSTIEATSRLAVGGTLATAGVAGDVAALTDGVLKAMLLTKIKATAGALLLVAVVGFGVGQLRSGTALGQQRDGQTGGSTVPTRPAGDPRPAPATDRLPSDRERLQGVWQGVEMVEMGQKAPPGLAEKVQITVTGDVMILKMPEGESEVAFELAPGKSPKEIDLTGRAGPLAIHTVAGIYAMDGDTWTICLPDSAAARGQRPRELATGEGEGKGRFLFKLRRRGEQKPGAGKAVEPPAKPENAKEPVFSWGKEVSGLRLGLALIPGNRTTYSPGAKITLAVAVRNVSTAPVTITYGAPLESKPTVTDAVGDAVRVAMPPVHFGSRPLYSRVVEPGKSVALFDTELALAADADQPLPTDARVPTVRVRPGEYAISYTGMASSHKELETGGLRFQVTDPETAGSRERPANQPATEKPIPQAAPSGDKKSPERKLTPKDAEALLPEAASLPIKDFEALLAKKALPTANRPPTHFVLTFAPTKDLPRDADQDFEWTTDKITPDAVARALAVSKGQGFASIIQLRYITDCTCESDEERARGRVAFRCDLYRGAINFKAARVKEDWSIREFEWPHLGVRFVRGEDNLWKQEQITPDEQSADRSPAEKPEQAETAWGQEVGGLQVGLSIGNRTDIRIGGKAEAAVHMRNVGKETVTVLVWPFWVSGAHVTDPRGNPVRTTSPPTPDFSIIPEPFTVKPGQSVLVGKTTVFVADARAKDKPFPDGVVDRFTAHVRPGMFRVDFRGFVKEHPALGTGPVSFEVKAAETDGGTAWGTEVGGLQAGLGYKPGGKRVYHHGETVTLVLRLRNVSKKEVAFSYLQPFVEHALAVTDGDGKPVPQPAVIPDIGERDAGEVRLPPGEEVELCELKRTLRPVKWLGNDRVPSMYGTGKLEVRYEQVLGLPEMGRPGWMLDPARSKLATGKLELEVTDAKPPAGTGKDAPPTKDPEGTATKPIKIRVYIEKVNPDTSTITASCMLVGKIDGVTRPLRLENLRVSEEAKITDNGKALKLADLKRLPADTHYHLFLKSYEDELGFEVVGIETIGK